MKIKLRDYQEELYYKIRQAFKQGYNGPLCVLPCRSRKIIYNGSNSRIG